MDPSNLYIKKSKLIIVDYSGRVVPDKATVGSYMYPLPKTPFRPHYKISGIFVDGTEPKFIFTRGKPTHYLYLTALYNPPASLDNYKLLGTVWSSYFQDKHGYYWQIINASEKMNYYQINHPKLIIQA